MGVKHAWSWRKCCGFNSTRNLSSCQVLASVRSVQALKLRSGTTDQAPDCSSAAYVCILVEIVDVDYDR